MGYLTDNTTIGRYGRIGDCPALYPYELVVQWAENDPFFYPKAVDQLGLAIKEVLPDVEDWQYSVVRVSENRMKLRFKDEAARSTARTKLELLTVGAIRVVNIVELDPPDLVRRGVE